MSNDPRYLVVDLGSTSIKAHVFSSQGSIISQVNANTPIVKGTNAELCPRKLWETVIEVMKRALNKCSKKQEVQAITVIGMAATYIPLDCNANPVSNAIMWYDPAGKNEVSKFLNGGAEVISLRNRLGQYPTPMYLPFRISWLRQKKPLFLNKVRWWVNVNDFITMRLIGSNTPVSDYSIASRTMLLDHNQRTWDEISLNYWGIPKDTLPNLAHAGSVVGSLNKKVSEDLGLSSSTKIILGAHDHMCTALGCGITSPLVILNSTGTSEAIVQLSSQQCSPADITARLLNIEEYLIPNFKALVGYVAPSGGILQSWFNIGIEGHLSQERLFEEDDNFYPPGVRMITDIPGQLSLKGTDFSPTRVFITIARGICFELKKICYDLRSIGMPQPKLLRIAGGLSRSKLLNQMKADILGCEVEVAYEPQLSAIGGMILCGCGTGDFTDISCASLQSYERLPKETFYPNSELYNFYNELYKTYERSNAN